MEELKLKLMFGTEMFLRYNDIFEQMLKQKKFTNIKCSIDKECIYSLRGSFGEDFYKDNIITAKFIFSDNRIEVTEDQSYEPMSLDYLNNNYGIYENFNKNQKLIEDLNIKLPKKYITISTKIQYSLEKEIYNEIKYIFFDILNSIEVPIIILGEREIKPCVEYDLHNPFSIYSDLIENLNNYIDFTIEDSSLNNNLELLKRTFFILNKSCLNIFISFSGVKALIIYSSDNYLGLTQYLHIKNKKSTAIICYDVLNFLNNFKNIKSIYEF